MDASYRDLLSKSVKHVATSVWKSDLLFTKAKGTKIWLNGKPHLDFACGPGVANIGWNHPEVVETVCRVLRNNETGWGGNMLLNRYQAELAERLCQITPGNFSKKVFFSNSGGEAVEAAIIACMKRRPERPGMLSFIGDFHGRLGFGRTATTSKRLHIEGLPQAMPKAFYLVFPTRNPENFFQCDFFRNDDPSDSFCSDKYMRYVQNTIDPFIQDINFAIFELIQGEGGINIADKAAIQALFHYLKENGVWTIVDEVQTGLGRTGKMWASELYEVEPDIITVAKALSGGVIPIGATVMRDELSYQTAGEHCNTFGAVPAACAAGLKVLDIIEKEKLVKKSAAGGIFLRERVDRAIGLGQMSRMTFGDMRFRDLVATEALKRGLYLTNTGAKSLRLMPPLIITNKEIERASEIFKGSIDMAYKRMVDRTE